MYTFEYNLEVSLSQFSDITSFLYSSSALQTVKLYSLGILHLCGLLG